LPSGAEFDGGYNRGKGPPLIRRHVSPAFYFRDLRHWKALRGADKALRFSEHLDGDGEAIFRHACALGLEGIVSKRRDGRYRSGRSLTWLKVKNPDYQRR
jgi:hypothetical protein